MIRVDPERQTEYRAAWATWQKQLTRLHEVFLDGEALEPPKLKGLLNREARAKQRYDAAREALLGIGALPAAPGRIPGGSLGGIGRSPAGSIDSERAEPGPRQTPLAGVEEHDERRLRRRPR